MLKRIQACIVKLHLTILKYDEIIDLLETAKPDS